MLSIVEGRLKGQGGDPVIQIQTPFGGGKTHALIAMYHKASEWNAQKVVLVGTPMRASDTLWGGLEKQLTGKVGRFDELTSPGRDALYELLSENQPVLILMDEVLEYMTKAAGVPVARQHTRSPDARLYAGVDRSRCHFRAGCIGHYPSIGDYGTLWRRERSSYLGNFDRLRDGWRRFIRQCRSMKSLKSSDNGFSRRLI